MDKDNFLILLISFLIFDFLLERFLEYKNLKHQKEELPDELKDIYDGAKFRKSQKYLKVNTKFSFITSTFNLVVYVFALTSGSLSRIDGWVQTFTQNEVFIALIYFATLFLLIEIISLPFTLYHTFVIEERFGFNKMSVKTFFADKFKGYFLGGIIGGGLLYVLISLILKIGPSFWIYFWVILSVFILLVNMFYASLIVPLFNKLKPLEDGPLKSSIQAYSQKVNFPLENIFVIDGSKRSSKANAFFAGLGGKKKIVLYDTLIQNHSEQELVAVLAHEVGHFKKKHIVVNLILSIFQTGFMLWVLSKFIFHETLSHALGSTELSLHLNLIAFGILFSPISHITSLLMHLISRKNEFEADDFAKKTYGPFPLIEALKKLSVNNLSNLTPHPYYVFWHYSHPTLLQRLKNLKS